MRHSPPSAPGLVAIAASAGGLAAIETILAALPPTLPAAIAIVQHRSLKQPNLLTEVLRRSSALPVKLAIDGEHPVAGTVYLASPDSHLTVDAGHHFRLVDGRRIHYLLSSANPLFESAAPVYRDRLVAIVLTGGDRDGTDGVQTVAAAGGVVIAQDPETAHAPGMPASAIATGAVRFVLPLAQIPAQIVHETRAWGAPERAPAATS